MRRTLGVVCLVALSSCFSPVGDPQGGAGGGGGSAGAGGSGGGGGSGGSGGGAGGGGSAAGCTADSQCNAGMVCEGCTHDDGQCVPGCRNDAQCRTGEICSLGVTCLTCPCAPGWCVADPCLDADGDGVVASCDKSLSCPGKQKCDCNPFNAGVYPGAAERCNNGIDDDCDGLVDGADSDCKVCSGGQNACASSFDCTLGTTTCGGGGCCEQCPTFPPLNCAANECAYAGTGHNGCLQQQCGPCGAICPQMYAPVCGALPGITRTFGNSCEASSAQATVIHAGECVAGEGVGCGFGPSAGRCGTGLYCRDACPFCDDGLFTCTKVGACVFDFDCPAGAAPTTCPTGKTVSYACVSNACVASCN